MSSDNGIYIVYFSDGYRVTYAQNIENIDYFPEGSIERKQELKKYFGKSKIFQSYKEASAEAEKIANEILNNDFCLALEYGICFLGERESFL
jgi:hypothetical protein